MSGEISRSYEHPDGPPPPMPKIPNPFEKNRDKIGHCLECGETIPMGYWNMGSRFCNNCHEPTGEDE